jgi:hypothetical protein
MTVNDVIYAEVEALIPGADEETLRDTRDALEEASDMIDLALWELTTEEDDG